MRFQVPQFIDVEDKIFGPLTLKQFIYLAGGAGIIVVLIKILPVFVAILIGIPVIALSIALAFFKINNKPFIYIVEAFTKFFVGEKLYIWKREEKKVIKKAGEDGSSPQVFVPRLSDSKLKDLSWALDVKPQGDTATESEEVGKS
jgi:hypothetical protein